MICVVTIHFFFNKHIMVQLLFFTPNHKNITCIHSRKKSIESSSIQCSIENLRLGTRINQFFSIYFLCIFVENSFASLNFDMGTVTESKWKEFRYNNLLLLVNKWYTTTTMTNKYLLNVFFLKLLKRIIVIFSKSKLLHWHK